MLFFFCLNQITSHTQLLNSTMYSFDEFCFVACVLLGLTYNERP